MFVRQTENESVFVLGATGDVSRQLLIDIQARIRRNAESDATRHRQYNAKSAK